MTTVGPWTGRESRLLRQALRQSVRGFADCLGVPARTVSKWEQQDGARTPRPEFQAILDTVLARASDEARARFEATLAIPDQSMAGQNGATNRRQFLFGAALTPALSSQLGMATPEGSLRSPHAPSWASSIHSAVISPRAVTLRASERPQDEHPRSGVPLAVLAGRVISASLASNHSVLVSRLPAAIGEVEWSALHAPDSEQIISLQAVADVYAVAAWTLIKADDCLGAWVAAQRAIDAAEQAEDLLRVTAATRCLSEVHMRAGDLEAASRVAFLAAVHLDLAPTSASPAVACLRGAAYLSAAAAAARRGDAREARVALGVAATCGERLGEDRADLGTVFGPTNVAIHRVVVAVELGDAKAAVDHAREVDLTHLPASLVERRARFTIDVARAHAQLGDAAAALDALLMAERQSPDETRTHRQTHGVVRQLLARPRVAAEARALAGRCALSA
jgi:transcriptional regulator with XRE-family HTH domain